MLLYRSNKINGRKIRKKIKKSLEVDHMQLTQQLSLIRQLLRSSQSVLHEALARYHMGNYKLWISTAVLRLGRCWLKQKYSQTTTGLLLQFLKGQS